MHAFASKRQVSYKIWCHSKCHVKNFSFILHGRGAYHKFLLLVESNFIQNGCLYVYKDFRLSLYRTRFLSSVLARAVKMFKA